MERKSKIGALMAAGFALILLGLAMMYVHKGTPLIWSGVVITLAGFGILVAMVLDDRKHNNP